MTQNTPAKGRKTFNASAFIFGLAAVVFSLGRDAMAAQAQAALGSAAAFGVLAGTQVTAIPTTTVNGDLGVSPGSTMTRAPLVTAPFALHLADTNAARAQIDLATAYSAAAGRFLAGISVSGNLGGQTLAPGLYASTSWLMVSSDDLALDGGGDTNAVWIREWIKASSIEVTATKVVAA